MTGSRAVGWNRPAPSVEFARMVNSPLQRRPHGEREVTRLPFLTGTAVLLRSLKLSENLRQFLREFIGLVERDFQPAPLYRTRGYGMGGKQRTGP